MTKKIIEFRATRETQCPYLTNCNRYFICYYENKKMLIATNCNRLTTVTAIMRELLACKTLETAELSADSFRPIFCDYEKTLVIDTVKKSGSALVYFVELNR